MNFSILKKVFLAAVLLGGAPATVWSQDQWIDSILPPDHLLENLPWMGEEGKIESKGLFDFEDVRGVGQKDLVLIYRQSVPVNELDKPHNQTLIICFQDPKTQKYVKNFADEGGTIQWVKLVKDPTKKTPFLILQRDDLKGNQVLKGFVYTAGAVKQVLEAMAPQVFTKFVNGFQGTEIWASSKGLPKDKDDAEHVFSWDAGKALFGEVQTAGLAGWSGSSIMIPTTKVVEAKASPVASQATPVNVVKVSHPSKDGWWDEPLDPQAAFQKLKMELVPETVKKGQIVVLGQKANSFFTEVKKKGVAGAEFAGMRAGYYAAVASALLDKGNPKDAAYYLKIAASFQADNPDVVALKEKLKQ
jgi:hypothetical protein